MTTSDEANAENGKKAPRRKRWISGDLLIFLAIIFGLGMFFLPSLSTPREAQHRTEAINNLRQIGLGILNYSLTRPDGELPSAYIADEEGRPMHSWRVLILRELEREDLYEAYDFDKPWDDPENLKLVEQMPSVYASPFQREQQEMGLTPYQAVSASGTVLGTTRAARWDDLSRLKNPRIMVVTDFDHPVPWTKPEDISPAEIIARFQQFKRQSPSQFHVLMSDGAVPRIDKEITVEELGKMF